MEATTELIEGNLVRLSVQVDESEIAKAVESTAKTLSRQMRVPGFRPGKVPLRVLETRLGGSGVLRAEALRDALPDFYVQAIASTELDPIAPPKIDITSGQESGPIVFEAVVQVRPLVSIAGYEGLEVTVPTLEASQDEIDAQIDHLREADAELQEVDRPIEQGDFVALDLVGYDKDGTEVFSLEDYLLEHGKETIVAELDEAILGAKLGDARHIESVLPNSEKLTIDVVVKGIKDKKLPELSDEWVGENSEFSTVDELREDLASRIGRAKVQAARMELRDWALKALGDLVDDNEIPDVLVEEETRQRVHDLEHRLRSQRISIEQFLQASGRSSEELSQTLREDAHVAVKVDLALRALVQARNIEVDDSELDKEIDSIANALGSSAGKIRAQLQDAGRMSGILAGLRNAKAATWLTEHVALVDADGNKVLREDLFADLDDDPGNDDPSNDAETKEIEE